MIGDNPQNENETRQKTCSPETFEWKIFANFVLKNQKNQKKSFGMKLLEYAVLLCDTSKHQHVT